MNSDGGGREIQEDSSDLFLAKSFRFLNGKEQLLFQLIETLVRRQIQTVETKKKEKKGQKISVKT